MSDQTTTAANTRRLHLGAAATTGLAVLMLSIALAVAVGAVPMPLSTVAGVLANNWCPA